MVVRLVVAVVAVAASHHLGGHEMEVPVAHPGLGDGHFGQAANIGRGTLENGDLQAVLVVEMDVQGRQHQIVVGVLSLGEPARQLALVMVVNVGETSHGVLGPVVFQPILLQALLAARPPS